MTIQSPVAQVPEDQAPQRRRDYRPSPGRVTVIRTKAKQFHNEELGIVTSELEKEREEFFSIYATVARIGAPVPGGIEPWFDEGDVVTIVHSMFEEVDLVPGFSVWNGPFSAVTGVFEDPEPEE